MLLAVKAFLDDSIAEETVRQKPIGRTLEFEWRETKTCFVFSLYLRPTVAEESRRICCVTAGLLKDVGAQWEQRGTVKMHNQLVLRAGQWLIKDLRYSYRHALLALAAVGD